jgi:hypothetical protein
MYRYGPGRHLLGLALTAIVAAVAWFGFGQGILDKVNESNERSGGGGPEGRRIVSERRFAPVVAQFRRAVGSEAQLVSVTLRPQSVEFVAFQRGTARGYRWREGQDGLQTFEVGGSGQAGRPDTAPWPMSRLDPAAPQRIARAISAAEHGDFHLSIGDIARADSGRIVWILRGTIGERGVAYSANPDGRRVKPYNPASPELSAGARLAQCIQGAHGDPAKLQRCVKRYAPH